MVDRLVMVHRLLDFSSSRRPYRLLIVQAVKNRSWEMYFFEVIKQNYSTGMFVEQYAFTDSDI